jgi:hypothetical protein
VLESARVFTYDEEARLTKIERDNGQSVTTAYEYTYTGDGIRHMKKDHLAEQEYRYGCSIDCGGTPLRVYARELGSEDPWVSVEDYLQAGNALGYGSRWQIRYDAGEFLMAGNEHGEQYMAYVDNEGLPVVQELTPCVLQVIVSEFKFVRTTSETTLIVRCMEWLLAVVFGIFASTLTISALYLESASGFSAIPNSVLHWTTTSAPLPVLQS